MTNGEIVSFTQNGAAYRPYIGNSIGTNLNDAFTMVNSAMNDHATRIDALAQAMHSMSQLLNWVSQAHPEVLREYKAIKDIERTSNGGI